MVETGEALWTTPLERDMAYPTLLYASNPVIPYHRDEALKPIE
jgi:hypothetical protein